eukprot:TRINITY_DN28591_c0_g1_i1.p1 TRINITY_DN28591_c0_g1~~TRINITY_DN28591_c0_g1_i1.p1  ORF type:complete len:313 (-),score=38.83 TRINITY_DN28591_c0_g1_i1:183-1121(-)
MPRKLIMFLWVIVVFCCAAFAYEPKPLTKVCIDNSCMEVKQRSIELCSKNGQNCHSITLTGLAAVPLQPSPDETVTPKPHVVSLPESGWYTPGADVTTVDQTGTVRMISTVPLPEAVAGNFTIHAHMFRMAGANYKVGDVSLNFQVTSFTSTCAPAPCSFTVRSTFTGPVGASPTKVDNNTVTFPQFSLFTTPLAEQGTPVRAMWDGIEISGPFQPTQQQPPSPVPPATTPTTTGQPTAAPPTPPPSFPPPTTVNTVTPPNVAGTWDLHWRTDMNWQTLSFNVGVRVNWSGAAHISAPLALLVFVQAAVLFL